MFLLNAWEKVVQNILKKCLLNQFEFNSEDDDDDLFPSSAHLDTTLVALILEYTRTNETQTCRADVVSPFLNQMFQKII